MRLNAARGGHDTGPWLVPHPSLDGLSGHPEAAGDMDGVIQFIGTGEEPGEYYLHISGGQCSFSKGVHASPSLTITTPSEVWKAISAGQIDGQQAFMNGKYQVKGDGAAPLDMLVQPVTLLKGCLYAAPEARPAESGLHSIRKVSY